MIDLGAWGAPAQGVAAIERELARLRRDRTERLRVAPTVSRASVLNLIVFATHEVEARRAAASIGELSRRHPSRAIIVLADRKARADVEGAIAVRCDLAAATEAEEICYEQILIHARGDSDARIASAVVPLLLPDLPSFLWWTGTPQFGRRHFSELLDAADRVIVDAASFARPEVTLPRIAALMREGRGKLGVTDLCWTRLTRWRELVSQFFDIPDWRPYLDGIDGLQVAYAMDADGRAGHPSQALFLCGWLTSRLGWRQSEDVGASEAGGEVFAIHRPDGGRVRVRLRPRYEGDLAPGDLVSVRVDARHGARAAQFSVTRTDATHANSIVTIDGVVVAERMVLLPLPGVVHLLGEELTIVASDPGYEAALRALVALE